MPADLDKLKAAGSRADLAELLGFKPAAFSYILYKLPADKKYTTFEVAKRSGGTRAIKAPTPRLKLLQRRLSSLLQNCVEEINETTKRKDRAAHGFKHRKSIVTNARQHRHRRWVFNLDLEDFFPSINFGRVRGFFSKNRDFALNEEVATAIAQIACFEKALPQGSPCSPVISNLIASVLDVRLVRLAQAVGCTYTRYADDLSFSTNKRAFPSKIAAPASADSPHTWLPSRALASAIERSDFSINASKTHMMYRDSRQGVTGLVVNRKINVRIEYRRNVRAMVHRLVTTGTFHVVRPVAKDGKLELERRPGRQNELHGMLGFIDSVDVFNENLESDPNWDNLAKKERPYLQFLLYSQFYAAQKPVIVCEGDTDNVYLTHAIMAFAANYPELAEIKNTIQGHRIELKVRLYKYAKSSTKRILGLHGGGSANVANFIQTYRKEAHGFTGPGKVHPIVVVFDKDSGAGPIEGVVRQLTTQPVKEPFAHVIQNLYAVPTPLPVGATTSTIEDFFDAATKAIPVDGKFFYSGGKGFDSGKHIGKQVFAHRVVRLNAATINFDAFRPLLDNIVAAIRAHAGSPAAPAPAPAPATS